MKESYMMSITHFTLSFLLIIVCVSGEGETGDTVDLLDAKSEEDPAVNSAETLDPPDASQDSTELSPSKAADDERFMWQGNQNAQFMGNIDQNGENVVFGRPGTWMPGGNGENVFVRPDMGLPDKHHGNSFGRPEMELTSFATSFRPENAFINWEERHHPDIDNLFEEEPWRNWEREMESDRDQDAWIAEQEGHPFGIMAHLGENEPDRMLHEEHHPFELTGFVPPMAKEPQFLGDIQSSVQGLPSPLLAAKALEEKSSKQLTAKELLELSPNPTFENTEKLTEQGGGKSLKSSYDVILNDIRAMIHIIQRNITAQDIYISHQLMLGPTRTLFEHPTWSWDSEIIVRGVINSFPLEILWQANAFRRPDFFDILNLLRSFFCHQYPCQAGYCALQQFYKPEVSLSYMYYLWGEPNGNFKDGQDPITYLRGLVTDDRQQNYVLNFWFRALKFLEIFYYDIQKLSQYPYTDYLKESLNYKQWVTCVCHEDFGGQFCEPMCSRPIM